MRVVAIVQARMGSSRFPNKVMADLCGHPALWHISHRVARSKKADAFILATSAQPQDDVIEAFAVQNGIDVFRGSEENVLERFYFAARQEKAGVVIRLTGDNVLVSAEIIDAGVAYFQEHANLDYLYYREGLPLGMAVEILAYGALERAYLEAKDAECLEHVTPYLYRNPGKFQCYRHPCIGEDYGSIRWTMDTWDDYGLMEKIYGSLYVEGECFGYQKALEAYQKQGSWMGLNRAVRQKEVQYQGEPDIMSKIK